jgi:tight adherence protein C
MDLGERTGVDDLRTFVLAIVQAEQLGVGIAQTLKTQSDFQRMKRRQQAELAAQQAPVKMVFPLVFLIFPAMMMVILGPAAINLFETFSKR